MGFVAQKRTRLSGRIYERGEVVPTEIVTGHIQRLGLVAAVPDEMIANAAPPQAVAEANDSTPTDASDDGGSSGSPSAGETPPDSGGGGGGEGAGEADDEGNLAGDLGDYDPGAYTVAEVLAYAHEHPEFAEALVAAEVEGQDRVTLIAGLNDILNQAGGA